MINAQILSRHCDLSHTRHSERSEAISNSQGTTFDQRISPRNGKKRGILLVYLILLSLSSFAQEGYQLDFKVNGLADTTVYLGNFYGESTYIKDTAHVNANGVFSFTGKQPLDHGFYFVVLHKTRLFDIVIGHDQHFSIHTAQPDYIKSMIVKGDIDNQLLADNMHFNAEQNKAVEPYIKILKDSTANEAAKKQAKEAFDKISVKVKAYQDNIIATHPEAIVAKMLKAVKPIKVPEGKDYRYYRAHYWDNITLSDPTLLRLSEPIYKKKVEEYLDKLFLQDPDTLTKAIVELVNKAKENPETYKYLVWTVVIKYQHPEIMGLDEVFVNLYDLYFASGEMDYWAKSIKQSLKDRADVLRRSLIGKTAPNMIMLDDKLQARSMYDLKNKYTVLYFFDSDCGFCKTATPKMKAFKDTTPFDVQIFAVSADSSMMNMKKYIKEQHLEDWVVVNGPRTYLGSYHESYDATTTPTIYVLDEKKKIIAKQLPVDRLEEFLEKYEEFIK